jgi:hypothetical protein
MERETDSDGMRLGAQLGLSEPGGIVLLTGRYSLLAGDLLDLVDVTCILVDVVNERSAEAVAFRVGDRLPLVDKALRAAAVDDPRSSPAFLAEVARCVRTGGRVVAPAGSVRPGSVALLARDEREWVGEVRSTEPLTPLRRVTR